MYVKHANPKSNGITKRKKDGGNQGLKNLRRATNEHGWSTLAQFRLSVGLGRLERKSIRKSSALEAKTFARKYRMVPTNSPCGSPRMYCPETIERIYHLLTPFFRETFCDLN